MKKRDVDAALSKANPISRAAAAGPALAVGEGLIAEIVAEPWQASIDDGAAAAGRRRVAAHGGIATGLRPSNWRASRVLVAGLACLAFGGTAMAATGVWNPQIGTEAIDSPPPTTSVTPVSTAVTDSLAVLRRDPTDQDHAPEVEATLRTLGKSFGFAPTSDPELDEFLSYFDYGVKGVRPDSVRYLAPAGSGKATILFSAEDGGFGLFRGVGALDPVDEPLFLDGQGVCVYTPSGAGTQPDNPVAGSPICFVLDQILDGRAMWWPEGLEPSGEAEGVVPDGVASVTAKFPNGTEVDAPVADNYFQLTWGAAESAPVPGSEKERPINVNWEDPTEIVWYGAGGAVVHPQQPADEG
jgi:hypothetical protein